MRADGAGHDAGDPEGRKPAAETGQERERRNQSVAIAIAASGAGKPNVFVIQPSVPAKP